MMKTVFIGGCVRSGTTLLGSILGTHDKCICTPESRFKIDVIKTCQHPNKVVDIDAYFQSIQKMWRFKIWNLKLGQIPRSERVDLRTYSDLIFWLVKQYGKRLDKDKAPIWIDHTPGNLRHFLTLKSHFPQAKGIHIVRDGRGVAASLIPLDWGPNEIDKAAQYWTQNLTFGLAAEFYFSHKEIKRVRYEDLVLRSEETLKDVCNFIELDYQSKMLKGTGFWVPTYTIDQHRLIGKKVDPTRALAWKRELSSRQIEIFESLTYELLSYLEYPLLFGLNARNLTRFEKYRLVLRNVFKKKVSNRLRYFFRKRYGIRKNFIL